MAPHLITSVHHWEDGEFERQVDRLVARVDGAAYEDPIPYRHLAGGDYDTDHQLRRGVAPGLEGNDAHRLPATCR